MKEKDKIKDMDVHPYPKSKEDIFKDILNTINNFISNFQKKTASNTFMKQIFKPPSLMN